MILTHETFFQTLETPRSSPVSKCCRNKWAPLAGRHKPVYVCRGEAEFPLSNVMLYRIFAEMAEILDDLFCVLTIPFHVLSVLMTK